MAEQVGWRGLVDRVQREAPQWAQLMPQLPRLVHSALQKSIDDEGGRRMERLLERMASEQRDMRRRIGWLAFLVVLLGILELWRWV
jgi:ubiquinone biosynthesis protein